MHLSYRRVVFSFDIPSLQLSLAWWHPTGVSENGAKMTKHCALSLFHCISIHLCVVWYDMNAQMGP